MKIIGIIPLRLKNSDEKLVLEKIEEEKIIGHVINKIKKIKALNTLVLSACSVGEIDIYSKLSKDYNIKLYLGSENKLERLIETAVREEANNVAIFQANSPLLDPFLANELIEKHFYSSSDFTYGSRFPVGILPEAVSLNALIKIKESGFRGSYNCYIKENSNRFTINPLINKDNLENVNLSVNSFDNIEIINEISRINPLCDLDYEKVLKCLPASLSSLARKEVNQPKKRKFNKILNTLELLMGLVEMRSFPTLLRLDAHNLCNIRCKTCYQKFDSFSEEEFNNTFRTSESSDKIKDLKIYFNDGKKYIKKPLPLSETIFNKIESTFFPFIERISFAAYGEPFLNKNLFTMLERCKRYDGLETDILTNGTLFNEKNLNDIVDLGIDSISVSFDGANRKTYESIRCGANYNNVVNSLIKLKQLKNKKGKSKPYLNLGFTASSENIDELPELVDKAFQWGVHSIHVSNRYIMDFMSPHESLFYHPQKTKKAITMAKEKADNNGIIFQYSPLIESIFNKNIRLEKCELCWNHVYISSTGKVHLCGCSVMPSAGDIMDQPFHEIWNSDSFKTLRKSFRGEAPLFPECKNCLIGRRITEPQNIRAFMSKAHL